jgi:outer membrane receptor protein involved in Fe transport
MPIEAAQARDFAIPPGTLGKVIAQLGERAGLTIGFTDPQLAFRVSSGVQGSFSKRQALQRALAGTGTTFEFVNPRTVRIILAPPPRTRRITPPSPPRPITAPVETGGDIVVTASKQNIPLDRYAGSVDILTLDPDRNARSASRGTAAIVARLPILASTSLGPGRNKLFIRGVADSSFNGPSQATVGQYLGDVRLTYNAPDPDLNLYDIQRVEVLAGPQGTLYGTGALGGIIRFVPNAPDLDVWSGSAALGFGTTRKGSASNDVSAMLNAPLVTGRLGVRAVAYRAIDGGYIDDPGRGLANINRSLSYGGRVALRYLPGGDWTIDAGGVLQNIVSRDGQYTLRGSPDLTRRSVLAQPFDNDYQLASLRVAKRWGDMELISSTGLVDHGVETIYDATLATAGATPRLFDERINISLLSHETRLTGRQRGTDDWVIGISSTYNIERQRRRLGDPATPAMITGVRNDIIDAALFGQYTASITPTLSATLGGRTTISYIDGEALDDDSESAEPRRTETRLLPSIAASWRPFDRMLLFVHYQQAVRVGGLAVGSVTQAGSVQRFESDTLTMREAGFRFGDPARDRLAASATISSSSWSDIQADLVGTDGLPFTDNIGDGRIIGLDLRLSWSPASAVRFDLSTFRNSSNLHDPERAFRTARDFDLPNVAETGARATTSYSTRLNETVTLLLDGSLRYVGRSQLGIGAPLDVSQGRYLDAGFSGRLDFGRIGISLDLTNLADVRSNRFAFGNPFGIALRNQITPLRPRSIRFGVDADF